MCAKIHFAEGADKPRGVIVASLFRVDKVNGWSIKFKSKVREGEILVDKTGEPLLDIKYGESLLAVPNNRKRDGRRDPDFIVYAYPDEAPKPSKDLPGEDAEVTDEKDEE